MANGCVVVLSGRSHRLSCRLHVPLTCTYDNVFNTKELFGMNVPHGRSNHCADLQFKRSKVTVMARVVQPVGGWPQNDDTGPTYFSSFN